MRYVLAFLPLSLFAQLDLRPWSTWSPTINQFEGYAEHSGFGSGWNAAGIMFQHKTSVWHFSTSSLGKVSAAGLARIPLTSHQFLYLGWGLEDFRPKCYGQWTATWNNYQRMELRVQLLKTSIQCSFTYEELLESGWLVGLTAWSQKSLNPQGILVIQPPGEHSFGRFYFSTSGDWAVVLKLPSIQILFGGLGWPWCRTTWQWGKSVDPWAPL